MIWVSGELGNLHFKLASYKLKLLQVQGHPVGSKSPGHLTSPGQPPSQTPNNLWVRETTFQGVNSQLFPSYREEN